MANPDLIADLSAVFQHLGNYDAVEVKLEHDEDQGPTMAVSLVWTKVTSMGFTKRRVETMSKITMVPLKMGKPRY